MGKLRTDDPEEEKKQKDFKSMLNKLTPNNQEKLLQKFLAVGITQAKTLRNLIDQARVALRVGHIAHVLTLLLLAQIRGCGQVEEGSLRVPGSA